MGPERTRAEALAEIEAKFAQAGLESPRAEASALLRAALGLSALDMILAPGAPLGARAARVEAFAQRRAAGEPLARIEGRRGFWGLEFTVTPAVLDPRPDTETLVEAALAACKAPQTVLDLGVGSGAVLAALLSEWPQAQGLGVDASEAAAEIARANLAALGLNARVQAGNWGDELNETFDVIVSNPPYIRAADIPGLAREVREHDPLQALDGGADGLAAYRALAPQIRRLLAPEGLFFLEIGVGQGEPAAAILAQAGLCVRGRRRDLNGIERVLWGACESGA